MRKRNRKRKEEKEKRRRESKRIMRLEEIKRLNAERLSKWLEDEEIESSTTEKLRKAGVTGRGFLILQQESLPNEFRLSPGEMLSILQLRSEIKGGRSFALPKITI